MLSFRYHALTLVAVFLALAIGVVLGVAIGDQGVVSGAKRDLEKSLRGDLGEARERNRDLQSQIGERDDYEQQTYPTLVRGLLRRDRVGLLAIGNLPGGDLDEVRDAVEPAGARVVSVNTIAAPLPLDEIADEFGRGGKAATRSTRQLERLGRRVGRQLASGGRLPARLRHSLFSASRGGFPRLDAVVLVRDRDDLEGRPKARVDALEKGLIAGLRRSSAALAGVEQRDADPSQIGLFKDNDISTVDDIDLIAGHTALVYVLHGAKGNFGSGEGKLLPPAPGNKSD